MKRILIALCLSLICIYSSAQTIHWLTFVDTTDPNVGKIDVYNRQMLYNNFINVVNASLSAKGYSCDIHDYYGHKVTPENCKEAVESLSITDPNDIIVFYYIGHGGRPSTDPVYMEEHPYPQMCLAQLCEEKFIPLEWVNEQLSSKGARLSVTIGMCCNSVGSNVSIKDEPTFAPNYGPTYMSSNKIKRIQELFLNTKGHIIATSASPRQTSGCVQIAGPRPCHPMIAMTNPQWFRDWYSFAICCFFQTQLTQYSRTLNWNDFLYMIGEFVDRNTGHNQSPIYDIYLTKETPKPNPVEPNTTASKPTENKPIEQNSINNQSTGAVSAPKSQPPVEKQIESTQKKQLPNKTIQQGDEGSRDWINELTKHISSLVNVSLALKDRQNIETNLNEKLFADGAVVKFLAQDSNAVIDKMSVNDWLGILATNPNGRIIKVIVESGTFDSNKKITTLKVREIYKQ